MFASIPFDLNITNTTDHAKSASYRDIYLEIESKGRLRTNIYDKGIISISIDMYSI
jgi:hypothetical protein